MAPLIAFIVVIALLVAVDVAALRWGADSRPRYIDDHAR